MIEKNSKDADIESIKPVSVLVPVYNEAETVASMISELYDEVGSKIPVEVVVAEDGSTDGTKEILRDLAEEIPLKLIMDDRRKGYMGGVKDGLRHVSSEYIFFMDSDGQHMPSDFWKLYEKRHEYDLIIGKKIRRRDPFHRLFISTVFHWLIQLLFRVPVRDPDTGFRIMKHEVLDSVLEETRILKYSFWTEFTVRAHKKGFKVGEVSIIHRNRLHGDTRLYKLSKLPSIIVSQLIGSFKLATELKRVQLQER